jgi:Flp pilus assembly protein TadD
MPARRILGAAYLQAGRDAEGLAELQSAATLADGDPVVLAWLAHAKAVTGSRREASALIARTKALRAERYVPAYHLAIAYAGLGECDAAFEALDRARLECDPALANLAVEPRLEALRDDSRFAAMLEALHLR